MKKEKSPFRELWEEIPVKRKFWWLLMLSALVLVLLFLNFISGCSLKFKSDSPIEEGVEKVIEEEFDLPSDSLDLTPFSPERP